MTSESTRMDRGTSHIQRRNALLSLGTAILGIVTAAITLILTIPTIVDRDGRIASLSEQLTAAEATAEARQEMISDLRSENSDLRQLVPFEVDPEDAHDIRAAASVTLAKKGDRLDLNSTLPNFSRGDNSTYSDTIYYDGTNVRLGYGVSSLVLKDGSASYEACAAATGWAETTSLEPHLLAEPTTCLRLQTGRYAAVKVTQFDETTADVAITVWE
ncbi:hypothetical protein HOW07_16745 [Plantibacter sp. MCCC 1A11337]|uniref:hypothetical protein n=1 Tax=Plantibacter sp. MCCC 1A11337 TaxID=2736644 RepID=UPI0015833FA4|nr:hypothetical protein [Plantibacter sp. MCCC 1A11337]NUJ89665.1 hypothetical protein [Plantibacter sp. MCCC 1A11337]